MTTPDLPRIDGPEEPGGVVAMEDRPSEDLIRHLSARRHEPDWMLRHRLRGLERLHSEGVPSWAAFLRDVDFDGIVESQGESSSASDVDRDASLVPALGALESSEEAYRAVRQDLESRGIQFFGLTTALRIIPDILRRHFASVIPADDDPVAALNAALWTEGSFLYVPPGVSVAVPLQAEIREDYAKVEPFERNVIVADRDAELTYIEGCTAPVYTPDQLHVSAIEVVSLSGSNVHYIALQNFSKKVDNLVTKRAKVHEDAFLEWVDVNLGSRRTRKVPRTDLVGPGASAEFVGIAFAGKTQHQDVGAEMVHLAPHTRSHIVNHGIVQKGGRVSLRSGVRVAAGAFRVASSVEWSSLMLDSESRAVTAPAIEVDEADAEIVQQGQVRKVGEEMLFYMASRGLTPDEAIRMVVLGIAGAVTGRIPVEYAVEVDRLLDLELGGGVG